MFRDGTASPRSGAKRTRPRLADRLVSAQPPWWASRVLIILVCLVAVVAHVPGLLPAAVASGAAVAILTGVWTSGPRSSLWIIAATLATLPLPLTPLSAGVTVAAGVIWLGVTKLVQSLSHLVLLSHASSLKHYGERDELDRESRAQREQLQGQVEYWANHDRLTEVLNRSALTAHLADLAAARTPTGVLVVCVAGFTEINDGLGTDVGDELLIALARRLRTRARTRDVVARLGGDEFVVVLPGLLPENTGAVADRLLQVLTDPFTINDHLVPLHARCGLALDDGGFAQGPGELLRQASYAARSAKVDGVPAVFSATTQSENQAALALEADLHRALDNDEFFLLYQPLVSTVTGRIESVEALVRWQHPEKGLIAPDAFIPAAERSGQIMGIGLRVLEMAMAQMRAWSSGPSAGLTVAVNVSARQLLEPDFVQQVQAIVWGAGVDPRKVLLELTESLLVEDSDAAIATLWQLRGLGVRLAIDDFGTGYSSLARLGELPIDEMKIDKSFVDRLGVANHDSTALVTAAIAMGHGLGLVVVAEGIESASQAAQLSALDCDLLQGYLLGRPQTAEALGPQFGKRLLSESTGIPAPRLAVGENASMPGTSTG